MSEKSMLQTRQKIIYTIQTITNERRQLPSDAKEHVSS
jgi:hypothetical protein